MPATVIVRPETVSDPVDAVTKPGSVPVVDGADQPLGTTSVIIPFCIPPVAAVYVNEIVLPVLPLVTVDGEGLIVPEPSGESTATAGDEARGWSVPAADALLWASQLCGPPAAGALAPGPPLDFAP